MIKIIKQFFICSVGALILKGLSALITFISISFLSPSEFGLLSLINSFIAILPIFLNLGLRQAFGLDFFHCNIEQHKKILNDIIIIYLIFTLPILTILFFNISLINKYFFFNQANFYLILICLLTSFTYFFSELLFQTLRYQFKIIHLSILQIIMATINAISAFILIYFFKLKINGILLANFISIVFIFFYGLNLYTKKIGFLKFNSLKNKDIFFYYLKLGFPFVPSILFNLLISYGDRWILAKYASLNDVGIYSLADSFGQLYQLVILYPLSSSYLPFIHKRFSMEKNKINDIDNWNQKNMWISMSIMFIIVTIGFFSIKHFFYYLFPKKYYHSINFIWLILIEQIIFMGSYFATCYLVFLKKTYKLVSLTIFTSILSLCLNFILIPKFAIIGCIISGIISYSFYLFLILFATRYVKNKSNTQFFKEIYTTQIN